VIGANSEAADSLLDCNGDSIPDDCQCLWDDGMISPTDVNLLQVIDEPADVLAAIQKFHAEKSKPAETQQEAERQSGMYL